MIEYKGKRATIEISRILVGHTSSETACVVSEYPYGWKGKCHKKHWLEFKKNFGYRLVTQTSKPYYDGNVSDPTACRWNKPDKGHYTDGLKVMILQPQEDGRDFVKTVSLCFTNEYTAEELNHFEEIFQSALDETAIQQLKKFRIIAERLSQS